ncbi:MAG TPA: alpha-1,4-glucan--maltose-1-phosphate maltosyltransferase [Dehalococcoidales bacterium]|nr:alpha-1,4-glucan--maltose-1-phosphate maltosyltransferase [Dehalococcoidales bacterium]
MKECEDRTRVVIEEVKPEIDDGRFPIKRIVGDKVVVEADIFADGHALPSGMLLYRKEDNPKWIEVPMEFLVNDRWHGSFVVTELGRYQYTLMAWIDQFKTWQQDMAKKVEAKQDISVDFLIGAQMIEEVGQRARKYDTGNMQKWAETLRSSQVSPSAKAKLALSNKVTAVMNKYPDRRFATIYPKELILEVDREKARFSTWYEMFPRSCASELGQHGTFKDCETRLPYVSEMGFDVLYFPPIHPIGYTSRKGKNNVPRAKSGDPGTPWAIGSDEGGHKAVHPQLGTLEDFRRFIAKAQEYGIKVALDLAFQCSPDHPYVKEHPEWFRWRPDGTVQYAENPPKKYQDIYPLEFETEHWQGIWEELKSVVLFWIEQGVCIFRVDNPHTKPFAFWEWLIGQVKENYPEVIFLSEAFTRPKIMYRLTKLGFSQSYTYFAWRNTKWELTQYFTELTQTDLREFFRPNLWPNTPDILSDYLRDGRRPAFMTRLVLAASLSANYGIYGPAFELCENHRKDAVSEEYLDSEKYELKHWDIDSPDSLKNFVARVNRIRRENPALQNDLSLRFHSIDNGQLICYSKRTEDLSNIILVVVNLDYRYKQSGWVDLFLEELGLNPDQSYQVHDLLADTTYQWRGSRNYVELNPQEIPAHIFQVRRQFATG